MSKVTEYGAEVFTCAELAAQEKELRSLGNIAGAEILESVVAEFEVVKERS